MHKSHNHSLFVHFDTLARWWIITPGRARAPPLCVQAEYVMSAWHNFSRKLVAMASPSVVSKRALQAWSPSVLSKLALRSPLTHLLGKRQCRRLPSLAVCSQVSLAPSALPSQATALVLKYCPPEVLARLAVTSAAWACRILEHAAAEETWAAWAAMTPRPTLQHMQQVCAACTLRLPPSQTIEGLSAMEVTHLAYSPPQMAHVALHSHTRHRHAKAPFMLNRSAGSWR